MHFDSQQLMNKLDELDIDTVTMEHPPLRTVADGKHLRSGLEGGHAKNLFLKDKRGGYWLLAALEQTPIDLRSTAVALEAPRFSFAKAEELAEILGVVPGAVSPLAAINDLDSRVRVVLEQALLEVPLLNFHPLRNDRTITIRSLDLLRFLEAVEHPPQVIRLSA